MRKRTKISTHDTLCTLSLIKCFSTIKFFPKTRPSDLNLYEIFEFSNFLHFRMLIQKKILVVFVLACLFCSEIVAQCDMFQLNFTNLEGLNGVHNFTMQNFNVNNQPIYYSFHGTKNHHNETIIMWNNENWIGQTRIYDKENQRDFVPMFKIEHSLSFYLRGWKTILKKEDIIIKSRCVTFDNECLGVTNEKITTEKLNVNAKSRNQCIFPFKHKNVEYMNCIMADYDGLWCATSVDKDFDWQTRGFCTETCQFEGMYCLQF